MPKLAAEEKAKNEKVETQPAASSSIDGSTHTEAVKKRIKLPHKKIFVLILVLIIAVVGTVFFMNNRTGTMQLSSSCPDDLLKRAALSLNPSKAADLEVVVNEIRQNPKHKESPDCMYVLTKYYINISDGKSAQESLTSLTAVYDPKVGLSPILDVILDSPESLQPTVDFLKQQDKQSERGFNESGGPL